MPLNPAYDIGATPTVCLAHQVDVTRTSSSTYSLTWKLTPLEVQRPEKGQTNHVVKCVVCGTTETITVFSAEIARQRRQNLKNATVGGIVILLGGLLLGVLVLVGVVPVSGFAIAGPLLAFALDVGCMRVGATMLAAEDGVTFAAKKFTTRHRFRFPSRTVRPTVR